jgi:hypothetical protein
MVSDRLVDVNSATDCLRNCFAELREQHAKTQLLLSVLGSFQLLHIPHPGTVRFPSDPRSSSLRNNLNSIWKDL